ncbi:MAG: antirestriction protein, partial [SAR324 cluster bacterium]|nr:antirestriction protein [SAR324 cluster bacterium]
LHSLFRLEISFIKGWLKHLKDDPRAIFKAAALASKAVQYLTTEEAK